MLDRQRLLELTKEQLIDIICEQAFQIESLQAAIAALKKDSSTSSKPPSTDQKPNRTQSLRQPSGKPNGGQPGHQGMTRLQVENPDITIPCRPHRCARCGSDLTVVPGTCTGTRQEADIPPLSVTVTAWEQEEVICPCCGERNQGSFPVGINAPFQIGLNLKSLVVYLNVAHHVPFERLTRILSDLLTIRISQGTVDNTLNDAYRVGAALAADILLQIKQGIWAGSDETGTRVNGEHWWQWTWQNPNGTYYAIEPSRGYDVIDAHFGNDYQGKLVHDCWSAQNNTQALAHQLCHPHLLRDLRFCRETERSRWAYTMADFLLETETARDALWREGYDPRLREQAIQ
ncbi:MAG: IS66 family transposase, partial [Candidatus Micrarchaeota archaeon]